ncbi:MAG: efflux transporter outer membrane subunit [Desulfobacula sp.]|nr:efflux transporter outer membrane subunit [Desulfobacula sp.]
MKKKNMSFQLKIGCLLMLLSCGCTSLTEKDLPSENFLSGAEHASFERTYETKWWEDLNDPAVNILVEKTFTANPTLEQALAQLDEAKAQSGISKSEYFPALGVASGLTQNYNGGVETGKKSLNASAGPSLSWEMDLFGRIRNSNKAAQSLLDARTADAQNTRMILASDVVATVLDFRAGRSSSLVLESDLTSRKETLGLLHKKVQAGFSTQIDEGSASRDVAFTVIELALQNERCQKNLHALSALSGMDRTVIQELLLRPDVNGTLALPEPPQMPEDIDATALMSHPGVRAAAYDAKAAWADIKVAKAERLPKLDLSALLSGQWIRAAGTTLDFTTWALGATVSGILFDGGRGAATVDASKARYRGALAVLEEVLRTALQEAQDALAAQQSAKERYEASTIALKAAQFSFTAHEALWKNGSTSLLELEDSRRQLLTAQINLITAKRDCSAAWIALHRVLGKPIHTGIKIDEEI